MSERISEEDRLRFALVLEKRERLRLEERLQNMQRQALEAEQLRTNAELQATTLQLREKYKLTISDVLDAGTGSIVRKAPQGAEQAPSAN